MNAAVVYFCPFCGKRVTISAFAPKILLCHNCDSEIESSRVKTYSPRTHSQVEMIAPTQLLGKGYKVKREKTVPIPPPDPDCTF